MSEARNTAQRDYWVDALRGFGMVLVVMGHVYLEGFGEAGLIGDGIYSAKIIYSFHMPLVLGISGYSCYWAVQGRTWPEYLKSRCMRLFLPFFSWSALAVLSRITPALFRGEVSSSFLVNTLLDCFLYGPSMWYLWALFLFSLLAYALRHCSRPRNEVMLILLVWAGVALLPSQFWLLAQ